jgi:poly [ADP-ribose] polymerase 2/3/4
MTQKIVMLVKAAVEANNNKFYEIKLEDDGRVVGRNGRVGTQGVLQQKGSGQYVFDSVYREKIKKGYKEVAIAVDQVDNKGKPKQNLMDLAIRDILGEKRKDNQVLRNLITTLANINKHEIIAASGGKMTVTDGVIATEVGPLTVTAILDARKKLKDIQNIVGKGDESSSRYINLLNEYLMNVPQKVPARGPWHEHFFTGAVTTFDKQFDFLDQLETSIKNYSTAPKAKNDKDLAKELETIFGFQVDVLEDAKEFKKLKKLYDDGRQRNHESYGLTVKRVFLLSSLTHKAKFDAKTKEIGNVKRLWHGSRSHNILSILKSGLIVPEHYTNGFMFGKGIYHANIDCSTKSTNYSYGYWDGGRRDTSCFVFLNDVAMGKTYYSTFRGDNIMLKKPQHKGFDSTHAVAGKAGVINDEIIVPTAEQVNLVYLFELEKA